MAKVSQRIKKIYEKIEPKPYKATEALTLLKETATAKFVETAEAHISLRLDTKYADQQLRTTVLLPRGTGKKIKIGVIAQGDKIIESLNAGADLAGSDELIQDILKGIINFDRLIATPDMMPSIAKLGKILGPKGLMPSPKSGTVTSDVKGAIEEFKKGLSFDSTNADLWYNIGGAYFSNHQLPEAVNAWRVSLSIKPGNVQAQQGMQAALEMMKTNPPKK